VLFAHDTEVALAAAAATVNTDFADVAALDRFVRSWGWTGVQARDEAELAAVRALRPELRAVWDMREDEIVGWVNQVLTQARAVPQLVRHDGWSWHLHATPPEAPLRTRMAVEAAMALVDVVRSGELDRLRTCARTDCDNVLVDLSKNRSKRFCDAGCGNRAAVAAYRARKAAASK
jgi:predicted RNA-binding Zn ribbon-like protein